MKFTNASINLYIPVVPVTVTFHAREEVALNAFQTFLLQSINRGAAIDRIVEATKLTWTVIENELVQMEAQKLVERTLEGYAVTDLTRRILWVADIVELLNKERKIIAINQITGKAMEFRQEDVCVSCEDGQRLVPRIHAKDLDGVSVEQNMSFFATHMSTLADLGKETAEEYLTHIYAEFFLAKVTVRDGYYGQLYVKQTTELLPCMMGEQNMDYDRYAGNILVDIPYLELVPHVSPCDDEKYASVFGELEKLEDAMPELLSKVASDYVKSAKKCRAFHDMNVVVIYDLITGKFRTEGKSGRRPDGQQSGGQKPDRRHANLILPKLCPLDDENRKRIEEHVRAEFFWGEESYADRMDIRLDEEKTAFYRVAVPLESLFRQRDGSVSETYTCGGEGCKRQRSMP